MRLHSLLQDPSLPGSTLQACQMLIKPYAVSLRTQFQYTPLSMHSAIASETLQVHYTRNCLHDYIKRSIVLQTSCSTVEGFTQTSCETNRMAKGCVVHKSTALDIEQLTRMQLALGRRS